MASDSESAAGNSSSSSFLESLMNSRNSNVSLFLPLILSMTNNPNSSNPVQDSSDPDQQTGESTTPSDRDRDRDHFPHRIIMINPFTQGMVVIETSSSSSLASILSGLAEKQGQPPASKASIEGLPSVEICEDDEKEECVVCLDEMGVGGGGVVKEMPCKHRFHGKCVEKWLKIHGSCPVCRYKMPEEDGELSNKSENGRSRREIWMSLLVGSERRRRSEENSSDNQTVSSADFSSENEHHLAAPEA